MRRVETCRVCGGTALELVLDLGEVPLANALRRPDERGTPERRYPLELARCGTCGHVGLTVVVDPAVMFRSYPYLTGTSTTMRDHFARLAASVAARSSRPAPFVVEIGSNDGTLLSSFPPGTRVLGVEPARNVAAIARERGVDTLNEFFSAALAADIRAERGPADAVLANNVVAHIDDLADLASGVSTLLADDGVFVFEVPQLLHLVERVEFDTIYHEHLSYFSLGCLSVWLARFGLTVLDAEEQSVHGGSLRVTAGKRGTPSARVGEVLAREEAARLDSPATWTAFAAGVARILAELPRLLTARRGAGRRIGAYGAAAKGNTLLCTAKVGRDLLDYVVDKNPLKQGLFLPGTDIEVVGLERLDSDPVDDLLVLAWNLIDEIREQLPRHRARGGSFLIPMPSPGVV